MTPIEEKRSDESLGAYLARVREAHAMTIEQLSAATKIAVQHLSAIEAGNWKAFPVEAYLRSYLNSLCSKLGLDSKQVISWYFSEVGAHHVDLSLDAVPRKPLAPVAEEEVKKRSKAVPIAIILIGVAFLAGVHFMDRLSESSDSSASANDESAQVDDSNVTPSEIPDGAEAVPADSVKAYAAQEVAKKKDSASNGSVSQAVVDEAIRKSDLPASATIFISSTSTKKEVQSVSNHGKTRFELIGSGETRSWVGLKNHKDDDAFIKEAYVSTNGARMVYNANDTLYVTIGEPRAIAKMLLNGVETPLPEMETGRAPRFRVYDGKIYR